MKFKEFMKLQEVGTSTGDVACFQRIVMPMVTRQWPTEEKKKKVKKQPQVEESRKTLS